MFALQNSPSAGENFADLKLNYEKIPGKTAKFDLSLDVLKKRTAALELQLEYDTDLFAEQTALQILDNFRTILEAITDDPEQRLASVPLIDNTRTPSNAHRMESLQRGSSACLSAPIVRNARRAHAGSDGSRLEKRATLSMAI
jgi:non-ribosomal peptide synthetase component F